jgi:hypothetical protein
MKDDEFDFLMDEYIVVLYPRLGSMSNGIRQRWKQGLEPFEVQDTVQAIDQYVERNNPDYAPTLEKILDILDLEGARKVQHKRNQEAKDLFDGKALRNYTGADRTLAGNAIALCFALAAKEISSKQARDYCALLAVQDQENEGDYYAMAQAIEEGQTENAKRREKAENFRPRRNREQAANPDNPTYKLREWLKKNPA